MGNLVTTNPDCRRRPSKQLPFVNHFLQGADRWYCASFVATLSLAALVCLAATPARAQDAISKDGAAAVKASFINDLETLRGKFVGLAEAFPQDKYTWRPMEGVRSVSEVLMLAAMEGYSFIPNSFGAKPADLGSREEMGKLRTLTDKAQIIEHLNKGFAHAKKELEALDPSTLTGKRKMMGRDPVA